MAGYGHEGMSTACNVCAAARDVRSSCRAWWCQGEGCVFDPATYYGHHEAEWGMSWCGAVRLAPRTRRLL
eukprot:1240516-Rhodomonas_salina.1